VIRLITDRGLRAQIAMAVKEQQDHEDRHTIYALQCEVEIIYFGEETDPEMRWRWNIWQDHAPRNHPLFLGNASTREEAIRQAYGWINHQQMRYALKTLPVAIPLVEDPS